MTCKTCAGSRCGCLGPKQNEEPAFPVGSTGWWRNDGPIHTSAGREFLTGREPGSGDRLQGFSFGRLGFREGSDALVQCGQHATSSDREAKQVGISHLLMAH